MSAALLLLLAGCAGNADASAGGQPAGAPLAGSEAHESASAEPESPEPSALQSSTPAPPASRRPSAAPAKPKAPAPRSATRALSAGCGGVTLASRWASWTMPNPAAAGLPHPAHYTDLGNGTVRDDVTCLVWQRTIAPGNYSWAAAQEYCRGLDLAGGGWRMPTRVELTSLTDFTRAGPAIDIKAFPRTPSGFFWTGSPWTLGRGKAWIVNFYEGLASNAGNIDGTYYARCVRAPEGSGKPAYEVSATEVHDPYTGLTWQRGNSAVMAAAGAARYCADLTLVGHAWRLPSIKELATTVDDSLVAPAVNRAAFPQTLKKGWYLTSSPGLTKASKSDPSQPWALNYDDGYTNFRKSAEGVVRCVR